MAKKKYKKIKKFWKSFEGTPIDESVKEELKRAERRYNKQRAKSQRRE